MDGQGSPTRNNDSEGKRLTLYPLVGVVCALLVLAAPSPVSAQMLPSRNTLAPLDLVPRQETPPALVNGVLDPASASHSWTALTASGAADNPAENLPEPPSRRPNDPRAIAARPIRLKFTLGGEKQVRWEGHIRLQKVGSGRWKNLNLLSIDPKAVGLVRFDQDHTSILLRHSEALAYNSFQVECHATPEAQVEIQLTSPDNPQWSFYQTVPVSQLLDTSWSLALANSGHGIWIERPAEDQLHLESSLPRDIVEVGETLEWNVFPNRLRVARGTALKYHARVVNLNVRAANVWEERGDLVLDANGDYQPLPSIKLTAGPDVGVYQLQVDILQARSTLTTFLPNSVAGNPLIATRQVQWVVMPTVSHPSDSSAPVLLDQGPVDKQPLEQFTIQASQLGASPFRPFDMQRLPWLPRLQNFQRPAETTYTTRSSETLRSTESDGRPLWELGAQQWRVIEFPPLEAGLYWIDLELVHPMTAKVGLDLVQTDQWNRVPHWTTGSVWEPLPDPLLPNRVRVLDGVSGANTRWRTLHWISPSTTHPATLLCLSNRSEESVAKIGAITVSRVDTNQFQAQVPSGTSGRSVGYFLETPLITSVFAGRKPSPTATSPPLNDWSSYHDAAERLTEYLTMKNYSVVWLPVLKQGGSLFPLDEFQTLPRFENSSFGDLAQTSSRLDVVELLLRKLSEHHQGMLPVFDFSVPLPRETESAATVLNPLDVKFQQEVLAVMDRFAERYHRHPALRGVALELSPESPFLFNSETEGINADTVERFLTHHALTWPTEELGNLQEVPTTTMEQWVLRNHQKLWLQWRARELTTFFRAVQARLSERARPMNHAPLELHLVATGLHRHPSLRDNLYPTLRGQTSWADHWLKLGLDLEMLQSDDRELRLIVQQTTRQTVEITSQRRADMVTRGTEFWQVLEKVPAIGLMSQQMLRQVTVEALQETPTDHLGQTMLTFGVVSNEIGCEAPWSEALRRQDIRCLINQSGGLPRTEHAREKTFATAFAKLHDDPFTTEYQDPNSPVAIRQSRSQNGRSQIYLVNAAAWPVTCSVDIAMNQDADELAWRNVMTAEVLRAARLQANDNRLQPAGLGVRTTPNARLTIPMSAYSLVILEGPTVLTTQVNISESADAANEWLVAVKSSLFRRLRQASIHAAPMETLGNASFEAELAKAAAPNGNTWLHGQLKPGQSVERDPHVAHSGSNSLRIRNAEGVVWLRSHALPTPTTGRLSVTAWVRNDPERPVESIRLAIDGQGSDGRKYYRFGEIPLRRNSPPSPTNVAAKAEEWQPIAVHFDDLPEEGLVNVRVGFDLMKPGDLWIDSVQCFDRWLDANDQNVLSNRLGLAAYSLETQRNTWAALKTLDDYWLRFLLAHIPDPNEIAEAGTSSADPTNDQRTRNARGARRFLPLR
jgi:hypothetical protein